MANRFPRRGISPRGPKRTSTWVGSADQGIVSVAAGATVIVESNATLIDTTIVRTRGLMTAQPASFGVDAMIIGAYGIGIVSDQAFAAGAASLPGPWTDKDWGGWLVWLPIAFRFEATTDVGRLLASVSMQMDSKAMRKVQANETVVTIAESQATAFDVTSVFRMLVKLS